MVKICQIPYPVDKPLLDLYVVFVYNVCMRKQLSMKRMHMLSANYCISILEKNGDLKEANRLQKIMLDFMRYCWEHKEDDNLYTLPKIEKKKP